VCPALSYVWSRLTAPVGYRHVIVDILSCRQYEYIPAWNNPDYITINLEVAVLLTQLWLTDFLIDDCHHHVQDVCRPYVSTSQKNVARVYMYADGPKFISCDGMNVGRRVYEKDVLVQCDIQAQPAVDAVSIHWKQSPTRNVSLSDGNREGQFYLQLQHSDTSVLTCIRLRFQPVLTYWALRMLFTYVLTHTRSYT